MLLVDPLERQLDVAFLEAVHKAARSQELRACLASYAKAIQGVEFPQQWKKHRWLAGSVAYDGLTIGEFIVTLCKESFAQAAGNGQQGWLEFEGPCCLKDPFTEVIACSIDAQVIRNVVLGQVVLNNPTLDKKYYCTQNSEGDQLAHRGAALLSERIHRSLPYNADIKLNSAADRERLFRSIEQLSAEELLAARRAHEVATFFSYRI